MSEKKVTNGELEINNTEELNETISELVKDPSLNKPSEQEVEEAQKEYEKAAKEWSTLTYTLGTPEKAQMYCDYIKNFLNNRYVWQKDAWMGVIKLTEELELAEKVIQTDKSKSLELGYQAIEFTYYALSNPGGIGLEQAKTFEAEIEIWKEVAFAVEDEVEKARKKLKEIEFLQQKWGAMAQGFYLELEPGEEDEKLPEGVEEEAAE